MSRTRFEQLRFLTQIESALGWTLAGFAGLLVLFFIAAGSEWDVAATVLAIAAVIAFIGIVSLIVEFFGQKHKQRRAQKRCSLEPVLRMTFEAS